MHFQSGKSGQPRQQRGLRRRRNGLAKIVAFQRLTAIGRNQGEFHGERNNGSSIRDKPET